MTAPSQMDGICFTRRPYVHTEKLFQYDEKTNVYKAKRRYEEEKQQLAEQQQWMEPAPQWIREEEEPRLTLDFDNQDSPLSFDMLGQDDNVPTFEFDPFTFPPSLEPLPFVTDPFVFPPPPPPPPPPAVDYKPFWLALTKVLICLLPFGVAPEQTWSVYFEQIHLTSEPDDALLDAWRRKTFPQQILPSSNSPPHLSALFSAVDVLTIPTLPVGWFCFWDDLTPLGRLYCLECIRACVEKELLEEEPILSAWSFQFLVVGLLRGTDLFREDVRSILTSMGHLGRWHDRYVFAGGFLRHELVRHLALYFSINEEVVTLVKELLKGSDAVAFYEQVENIQSGEFVLLSDFIPCRPEDFARPELKVKVGLFQRIERIDGENVYIKYHGCPVPVMRKRATIKQPHIVDAIQKFV